MKPAFPFALGTALLAAALLAQPGAAVERRGDVEEAVAAVVTPLMRAEDIPGMAVGVVTPESRHLFYFGVASRKTRAPVTETTLFEIGSVSKTFTATLAAHAVAMGRMSLAEPVSRYVPALEGAPLGAVPVLDLGTHTVGGMPLQFPDAVRSDAEAMSFFRAWKPRWKPGSHRTYANPSIGLFGMATAAALDGDFVKLVGETILFPLGLEHIHYDVPEAAQTDYAQGYTAKNKPARMSPGVLGAEAYGVRTNSADLLRFVEANMGRIPLDADLSAAIEGAQAGHYRVGAMTQALVWERYALPVRRDDLVRGNSRAMNGAANPVERLAAPATERNVLVNKTGSTRGFGTYVVFLPEKGFGLVLLANKQYPNEARVEAAYDILDRLGAFTP